MISQILMMKPKRYFLFIMFYVELWLNSTICHGAIYFQVFRNLLSYSLTAETYPILNQI